MSFFKTPQEKIEIETKKQQAIEEKIRAKEIAEKQKELTIKLYTKLRRGKWFSFYTFQQWIIRKYFRNVCFVARFELDNGDHTQLLVKPMRVIKAFNYQGGSYVIDETMKYYDASIRYWCLDYHQSIPFPIKRAWDTNLIRKAVLSKGTTDVDAAINPLVLRELIKSDVIQKVLQGVEMDKVFRFIKLMLVLIAIGVLITTIIILQQSGVFSAIGGG